MLAHAVNSASYLIDPRCLIGASACKIFVLQNVGYFKSSVQISFEHSHVSARGLPDQTKTFTFRRTRMRVLSHGWSFVRIIPCLPSMHSTECNVDTFYEIFPLFLVLKGCVYCCFSIDSRINCLKLRLLVMLSLITRTHVDGQQYLRGF